MSDFILNSLPEGIQPDTPEYEEYMSNKVQNNYETEEAEEENKEGEATADTPNEEQPTLYAKKYSSVEELEKGYLELQKAFSAKQVPVKQNEEAQQQQQQADQVDFSTFVSEYVTTGEVSEKSYKELEGKGINKTVIDLYIKGVLSESEKYSSEIFNVLGSKEKFDEAAEWARESLEEDELNTLNEMLASGNLKQAKLAAEVLKNRFGAADVTPRTVKVGHTVPSQDTSVFRSQQEMANAIRDSRYKSDPSYRAIVEQKIERSRL